MKNKAKVLLTFSLFTIFSLISLTNVSADSARYTKTCTGDLKCGAYCNQETGFCVGNDIRRNVCNGKHKSCDDNETSIHDYNPNIKDIPCGKTATIRVYAENGFLADFLSWYSGSCTTSSTTKPITKSANGTKVCGKNCTKTSDCRQDLGPTTCAKSGPNAGKCVNTLCSNDTQNAQCGCGNIKNSCGERCGIAYGLCDTGLTCVYAEPTCNWSTSVPTAYCMPKDSNLLDSDYSLNKCSMNDTGGRYLRSDSGKTSKFTEQELQDACTVG